MKIPRFVLHLLLGALLSTGAIDTLAQQTAATVDVELGQRHYRRGNTYNNLQRFDEAIAEYQLSITADPSFADSFRMRGTSG